MSATPFTDDAFNKHTKKGCGTLVGNWFEERSIRESTGEGRTVPQRHIPRSGLLKDWTKVPSCGPRKSDDTFERCYGHRQYHVQVPYSKAIGAGDSEHVVRNPVAETLQAEGRIPAIGPRTLEATQAMREAAEEFVQAEDAIEAEKMNARFFETTTGVFHAKPDETKVERPQHYLNSQRNVLTHGPPGDRSKALQNAGLEAITNDHYANVEAVTGWRMALAEPTMRSDVRASAAAGICTFGKHSEFSKPMGEFYKGTSKDDEIGELFRSLQGTQPLRTLGGTAPISAAFAEVPSLAALKAAIKDRLLGTWGPHGYVTLRQRLHDLSDHEGFVPKAAAVGVLREDLGLSDAEVSPEALSIYLDQQLTMKKTEMRVSALLTSLRPSLPQALRAGVLRKFAALGPKDGCVRLGDWLAGIADDELRRTLVGAFGGDDEASIADLSVPEAMFFEVFADLAALADPMGLL